ncbi:hypothetical protein BJV85_002355 [Clostridium acetobutylicum]|nr:MULTISPECIES: hypothetical protein [Clostridium]NOV90468.1 hypothetical protein [Clostridium acetobutylicum]NOW15007.1 hypothetical protein [Clostridium acetobutylicum]NRY56687.1 hypothetical protein [Clostridium acetobutylicum]NSA93432.1 hypothetical protein [Clostridium acetobutylicum]NYC94523.1 hypothetical protein [Clostridium acetobutylicum]
MDFENVPTLPSKLSALLALPAAAPISPGATSTLATTPVVCPIA